MTNELNKLDYLKIFKKGQIWQVNLTKQKFKILRVSAEKISWKFIEYAADNLIKTDWRPSRIDDITLIEDKKQPRKPPMKQRKRYIVVNDGFSLIKEDFNLKSLFDQIPTNWSNVEIFEIGTGQKFTKKTKISWQKVK